MFAFLNKKKLPTFLIRIFRFEFWPSYIIYFPVSFYWAYLALRSGSLTFFTAVNPGFKKVGFLRESKIDTLKNIPPKYLPKTVFVSELDGLHDVRKYLKQKKIFFPLICKPNIGERGLHVEIIKNYDTLNKYILKHKEDFIIQEYIPFEIELGVFFYQFPDKSQSDISSIVEKEFLHIIGNGESSIQKLMEETARGKMQKKRLIDTYKNKLHRIPKNGEKVVLEPIGNHCRGTTFLDAKHLYDPRLLDVFSEIATKIDGFYFGRFDIRAKSIEDLYKGENFKILEINGIWSEPAHIYDPNYSLWKAYKEILRHHKIMYTISKINHQNNIPFMSLKEALTYH